jgi:S-adenosylmethionine:tRNA ribosyltransferase-isomerase
MVGRHQDLYECRFDAHLDLWSWLEEEGELPIPPYMNRAAGGVDDERYQTVYARERGAVAAPTAGLHFSRALLEKIEALGVVVQRLTLHVGAGTFQPVRVEEVKDHIMHPERYVIPEETIAAIRAAQREGRRIVAIGTTSLRALEAARLEAKPGNFMASSGDTRLFITPGFQFQVVDRLLTNFHLPKSTLLMLVQAFGGRARLQAAYAHAIREKYRFFSYGDAMLIDRESAP